MSGLRAWAARERQQIHKPDPAPSNPPDRMAVDSRASAGLALMKRSRAPSPNQACSVDGETELAVVTLVEWKRVGHSLDVERTVNVWKGVGPPWNVVIAQL